MDIQKIFIAVGLAAAMVGGSYSIAVVTVAPVERDIIHVSKQLDRIEGKLDRIVYPTK